MSSPKTLKRLSLSKLEDLCVRGVISEEKFNKQINSEYNKDHAEMIIAGVQQRIKDKEKSEEGVEEIPTKFVRTITNERSILEAIMWKGNPMFLVYNSTADPEKRWVIAPMLNTKTVRYMPMPDTPYPRYGINDLDIEWMKDGTREIPPLSWYYPKVYNEIKTFISAPKISLSLFTNTALLSYEQHKHNSLGYLGIYGIPDTGKTRVGEIIAGVGYRPLMSMKLNAANVYDFIGTVNEGDCTIIDDEIQDLNDDPEKGKIYRSGYRKGAKVRRILDPSSTKRTHRYYNTYCLKILLGYWPPNDTALISRTIPTIMISGYPEKDEIDDEDRLRFLKLKNELLLSRMVHYFDPLPPVTINLRTRIKEVWKAQLLCSYDTPAKEDIEELVKEYITELEFERRESLDAYLTTVVIVLQEFSPGTLSFNEIWHNLLLYLEEPDQSQKTKVFVKKLDRSISKWVIGKKLGTVLAGKRTLSWTGEKAERSYNFQKDVLKMLEKRFNITGDDKFNCTRVLYVGKETIERAAKMWRGT